MRHPKSNTFKIKLNLVHKTELDKRKSSGLAYQFIGDCQNTHVEISRLAPHALASHDHERQAVGECSDDDDEGERVEFN